MVDFSIIVPVYNAEKTLSRCLESLLMQREENFEVLMIENGSTDKSNSICREFVDKDSRFRLFTSEVNCGPSGARNIGIENAKGKWVSFVDSDDWVQLEYLTKLRVTFEEENAEAVFMGYYQISPEGILLGEHIPEISNRSEKIQVLVQLSEQDMFGYTWIKAFKRTAIGDERFPVELNLFEDEVFACRILKKCENVKVIDQPLYNYVVGNQSSLMGRTHQDYCMKRDWVYRTWVELLNGYDGKQAILDKKANEAVESCRYYCYERNVDVKDFCAMLSQCEFFKRATEKSEFKALVEKNRIYALRWKRSLYQLKVAISKIIRKSRS